MSSISKKILPDEFYTASTFFTLSGAAGAVWLLVAVIDYLDSNKILTPNNYKFIVLGLCEFIAIVMILRINAKKKLEHFLLGFFNGLLIFVNASGLNAITSSQAPTEKITTVNQYDNTFIEESSASMLKISSFFKNQVNWWSDNDAFIENRKIKLENQSLKNKLKDYELNFMSIDSLKVIHRQRDLIESLKSDIKYNEASAISPTNNLRLLEAYDAIEDCEDRLNNLTNQIERLKEENGILLKKAERVDELEGEIIKLKSQIRKLQAEASTLKNRVKELQAKESTLKKTLRGLQIKEGILKNKVRILERELKTCKDKLRPKID